MANPFPANFEGLDGSRRLTGQVNFTDAGNQPGSSQAVSLGLFWMGDVKTQAQHDFDWSAAFDNIWDQNPLVSLPAGIGLSVAFNGSSNTITTTAAGTWAFTYGITGNADATWQGFFNDGQFTQSLPVQAAGTRGEVVGETAQLPVGAILAPVVTTDFAATAVSLNLLVNLIITRLA